MSQLRSDRFVLFYSNGLNLSSPVFRFQGPTWKPAQISSSEGKERAIGKSEGDCGRLGLGYQMGLLFGICT